MSIYLLFTHKYSYKYLCAPWCTLEPNGSFYNEVQIDLKWNSNYLIFFENLKYYLRRNSNIFIYFDHMYVF